MTKTMKYVSTIFLGMLERCKSLKKRATDYFLCMEYIPCALACDLAAGAPVMSIQYLLMNNQ